MSRRSMLLGDVTTIVAGQSPKGSDISDFPAKYPFHQGVRDFGRIFPTDRTYVESPPRIADIGDVLLSVRAPIGRVNKAQKKTAIGRGLMAVRGGEYLDSNYLFYFLESLSSLWGQFESGGSVFANLGKTDLARVPIHLPPIHEQRAIAATLGALDDKIESNRRAIDLAENLADQLFCRQAKDVATLTDVAKLTMGSSPPGNTYNEDGEGIPFYQGVRDFGRRFPGHRVWTTGAIRLSHDDDTLVSVRAPVGELNRSRETCCIGRGVAAITSDFPSSIYYSLRAAQAVWGPVQQEGTVFGAINKADLSKAQISWPYLDALSELEGQLAGIDKKIRSLSTEVENLIALRDTLLPELLSGRIRVPEARETTQEVVA